jgi:hypothetical protein
MMQEEGRTPPHADEVPERVGVEARELRVELEPRGPGIEPAQRVARPGYEDRLSYGVLLFILFYKDYT